MAKIIRKEIASLALVFIVALNCKFLITHGNWLYCRGVQNRESLQLSLTLWWIFLFLWAAFARKSLIQPLFSNIAAFSLTLFLCTFIAGITAEAAAIMVIASGAPFFGLLFWFLNKFEYQTQ